VGKLHGRSLCHPVRLQSVQGRGEEAQKGAPFYNIVVDGQKVVSLSRFRRPSIRIKHPIFLIMGYLKLRFAASKGAAFFNVVFQQVIFD
jgi:hypothetical protein